MTKKGFYLSYHNYWHSFFPKFLKILKQEKVIKLNMFGLTIGTYDKFEELYKFMMRTKYTV